MYLECQNKGYISDNKNTFLWLSSILRDKLVEPVNVTLLVNNLDIGNLILY